MLNAVYSIEMKVPTVKMAQLSRILVQNKRREGEIEFLPLNNHNVNKKKYLYYLH